MWHAHFVCTGGYLVPVRWRRVAPPAKLLGVTLSAKARRFFHICTIGPKFSVVHLAFFQSILKVVKHS